MLRQRAILFYPLVLAAYPVSLWYAENAEEAFLLDAMATLAIVITATVFVTLLLRLFVKDDAQVAVMVFIFLALFFSIVAVHRLLGYGGGSPVSIAGVSIGRYRYLMPFSAAIALLGVTAMIRYRWNLAPLVKIVTYTTLVLLLFNGGRVVWENRGGPDEILLEGQPLNEFPLPQANIDQLPDIYYIILDSYARADVLHENLGYDNSEFINSLTSKGFFVATESRSNYKNTHQSLSTSLSMRYLRRNEKPLSLLKENAVAQLLKRMGYQYVHVSSGVYITDTNRHADVLYRDKKPSSLVVNEFSWMFFRQTVLHPLATFANYDVGNTLFMPGYANHFNHSMRRLRDIPDNPSPTFTFSHNLPPHDPFVFDRDGNMPADSRTYNSPSLQLEDKQRYLDQLFYVSNTIDSVIDDILKRSSAEPIIIVQSDHGPPNFDADVSNNDSISASRVLEVTAILNAYYLPEYCRSGLYPTISPVNTFRVVLNACLGTNFNLLPDKSYWDPDEPPIDFTQFQQ